MYVDSKVIFDLFDQLDDFFGVGLPVLRIELPLSTDQLLKGDVVVVELAQQLNFLHGDFEVAE